MLQQGKSRERRKSTTRSSLAAIFSVTRNVSDVDIEVSRALFNREGQRNSSVTSGFNIKPKPSVVEGMSKETIGRQVWFDLDRDNSKASSKSDGFEVKLLKHRLMTMWPISNEEVTYSLNTKNSATNKSVDSFDQLMRYMSDMGSSKATFHDEDSSDSSAKSVPDASFEGGLRPVKASNLLTSSIHLEPSHGGKKQFKFSLKADLGKSSSFLSDDIWPWPWLHPEMKSAQIYTDDIGEKVTFAKQSQLVISKIPLLALTLKRYLASVKPCVDEAKYKVTQKAVEAFALGVGKLHTEQLVKNVEGATDWLKNALPNYTYVFSRQELPLQNISIVAPFLYDLWPPKAGTQIERTAVLIQLALEFCLLIRKEALKPLSDENGDFVCMHSFRKLFSSCRIPGIPEDGIGSSFACETDAKLMPRHIIVIHAGNFFLMDAIDENWQVVRASILKRKLSEIVQTMEDGLVEEGPGVGVLTSASRSTWTTVRKELISLSADNAAYMQLIEQAVFVVSLDHLDANPSWLNHEAVFADGCNRWYDKCLSFYVYSNGLVTVNVNRTTQDGMAAAALLHYMHVRILEDSEKWDDDVAAYMSNSNFILHEHQTTHGSIFARGSDISNTATDQDEIASDWASTTSLEKGSRLLLFDLNDFLLSQIENSKSAFASLQAALCTGDCVYDNFEKGMLHKKGIHPDAFAHLIVHLTFFRMYYRMAAVGTRVHLYRFYHGRYELMRSATMEMKDWCLKMMSPDTKRESQIKAFWAAEKKHEALYQEAISGQGCQNHLTALKLIGEANGDIPEMFQDGSYRSSGGDEHFDVFAESLGLGFLSRSVVMPTHTKGYGVGYTMADARVTFYVTSWMDERSTSAELLASSLYRTLELHHDFFNSL